VRGEDVASNSEAHYASATQHAHAARPPSAREIIAFLMLSYAARLRRRLMRNPLDGSHHGYLTLYPLFLANGIL